MRRDPLFLAFTVKCTPDQNTQQLVESLRQQIAPDAELIDTRVSSEGTDAVHHRIGEFFDKIVILPDVDGKANQFRLVFHRHANAGRFWKDLMIRIVHSLEEAPGVSVSLDYQGDVLLNWMQPMLAN